MFELSQSQLTRAIDILRAGPMKADVFAVRMWPDKQYSRGNAGRAGHLVLRRLGALGLVEKIGDLWAPRGFSKSSSGAIQETLGVPLEASLGEAPREPLEVALRERLEVLPRDTLTDRRQEELRERRRLEFLVRLGDAPVAGVTYDAALGNIRVRGILLDGCLQEACVFSVLRGRSLNVYLPTGGMIVALQPGEAVHALNVQCRRSGAFPELPYRGGVGWIFLDDGIAALAGSWRPQGADPRWKSFEEPFLDRLTRQRAEAGLGPAVRR